MDYESYCISTLLSFVLLNIFDNSKLKSTDNSFKSSAISILNIFQS